MHIHNIQFLTKTGFPMKDYAMQNANSSHLQKSANSTYNVFLQINAYYLYLKLIHTYAHTIKTSEDTYIQTTIVHTYKAMQPNAYKPCHYMGGGNAHTQLANLLNQ